MPHQTNLKSEIDQSIDLDTMTRRFEAQQADPNEYTKYFIDRMASLCAQSRDENIQKLRTIDDPIECFRFTFCFKSYFQCEILFTEELWNY